MAKATKQQTKQHNSRLILRTIYQREAISRASIARETHLTRPTVSAIVTELLAADLVFESHSASPSALGGKPATMLVFNEHAYQILCVDIGNQHYRGALINLRGEITERISLPSKTSIGEEAIEHVYRLIDQLLSTATTPILGIGLGTPGFIDARQGIVRQAVNLGWQDVPLRDRLSKRYDLPIYLTNDGHASAFGEYTFGDKSESDNLILIKTGQGIGAGIVINGGVFYGDGFGAGEIGQSIVAAQDGKLMKLEALAGTRAILRSAQAVADSDLTWEQLVVATAENSDYRSIVQMAGHYLGITVANLIAAYNINAIVLSGRLTQFGDLLLESIENTAQQYALLDMVKETTITFSELGSDIVLLGCAGLIIKDELGVL